MLLITEEQSAAIIDHSLAFDAVRDALISATQDATIFPVIIAHSKKPENIFAIKSATTAQFSGLKIGTYWPGNSSRGLANHGSTIILLDPDTGKIKAVIEASRANAFRTAAADAVATAVLARSDARCLALFGTGHQARYEVGAIAQVRNLKRIFVVGRDAKKAESFGRELLDRGFPAEPAGAQSACAEADIIVTATTANSPLFEAEWVRPGTHISAMGSDTKGKQELPVALFETAKLFCDLPDQSRSVGEFQHADPAAKLTAIGDVLTGTAAGRTHANDITIFDSSGLSIQDLFVGAAILSAHAGAG